MSRKGVEPSGPGVGCVVVEMQVPDARFVEGPLSAHHITQEQICAVHAEDGAAIDLQLILKDEVITE